MTTMTFTSLPSKEELARRFAEKLRAEIGAADFDDMRRMNREERCDGVCHSHDFCDANMVMLAALESFSVSADEVCFFDDNDPITALWNAAWDLAFVEYLSHKDGLGCGADRTGPAFDDCDRYGEAHPDFGGPQ